MQTRALQKPAPANPTCLRVCHGPTLHARLFRQLLAEATPHAAAAIACASASASRSSSPPAAMQVAHAAGPGGAAAAAPPSCQQPPDGACVGCDVLDPAAAMRLTPPSHHHEGHGGSRTAAAACQAEAAPKAAAGAGQQAVALGGLGQQRASLGKLAALPPMQAQAQAQACEAPPPAACCCPLRPAPGCPPDSCAGHLSTQPANAAGATVDEEALAAASCCRPAPIVSAAAPAAPLALEAAPDSGPPSPPCEAAAGLDVAAARLVPRRPYVGRQRIVWDVDHAVCRMELCGVGGPAAGRAPLLSPPVFLGGFVFRLALRFAPAGGMPATQMQMQLGLRCSVAVAGGSAGADGAGREPGDDSQEEVALSATSAGVGVPLSLHGLGLLSSDGSWAWQAAAASCVVPLAGADGERVRDGGSGGRLWWCADLPSLPRDPQLWGSAVCAGGWVRLCCEWQLDHAAAGAL